MGNKIWAGFTLKVLLSEPKYHGEQNVYVKELLREPEKSQLGTKGTTLERTNHKKIQNRLDSLQPQSLQCSLKSHVSHPNFICPSEKEQYICRASAMKTARSCETNRNFVTEFSRSHYDFLKRGDFVVNVEIGMF
jgi:hypothetical protein